MAYSGDRILSVWDLSLGIIGIFTGPIAGLFTAGIFTTRAHGTGGLIGLLASMFIVFFVQYFTEINFFLYGAIGVVACFTITYIMSLIIPAPQKSTEGLTVYSMPAENDI